ncbi:hypothetical protein TKK_0003280 [Trichogramma kaykai]
MSAFYILLLFIFFKNIHAEPEPQLKHLPTIASAVQEVCLGNFRPISSDTYCDIVSSVLEIVFRSSCSRVESFCPGFKPICRKLLTNGICQDLFMNVTIGDKPATTLVSGCLKSEDIRQSITDFVNISIEAVFDRQKACENLGENVEKVCVDFVHKEACPRITKPFSKTCESVLDNYVCKVHPGKIDWPTFSDFWNAITG